MQDFPRGILKPDSLQHLVELYDEFARAQRWRIRASLSATNERHPQASILDRTGAKDGAIRIAELGEQRIVLMHWDRTEYQVEGVLAK